MTIEVTSGVIATLVAEATSAAPDECCGILLGVGRVVQACPAVNVSPDPRRRFEIDPRALVAAQRNARSGGLPVIGYYHSHPSGLAVPSSRDRAQSGRDGRIWAIVAEGDVTFWRDDAAGFVALSYKVVDG